VLTEIYVIKQLKITRRDDVTQTYEMNLLQPSINHMLHMDCN